MSRFPLIVVLFAAFALAGEEPHAPVLESDGIEGLAPLEAKLPTRWNAVLELIASEKADIAALEDKLGSATENGERFRLERAIADRRVQLQIGLLQLRHDQAIEAQDLELAASIREHMDRLSDPRPIVAPQRPVLPPRERAQQR